jgi:HD-GYP domain-containing protein (c-di-GMP phosphodiesterase class II)
VRVQIQKDQLRIGEALPWDVYDADGHRIFKRGFVFRSHDSLSRIMQMELYYDAEGRQRLSHPPLGRQSAWETMPETESRRRQVIYEFAESVEEINKQIGGNIFHLIDYAIASEERICEQIINGATDQLQRLNSLIDNVIHAYTLSPDACLAAVHMDYEHSLSSLQPVYTAFLCLLMAEGLTLSPAQQYALVAAALTANLGMFKYFDFLVNRSSPLDEEELVFVRAHPEASYTMLRANHVENDIWLNAILQHHERGDGGGYPKGLQRDAISLEASILAAVDTYIAMVTPRAYRRALMPKAAMQQIYKTAVATDDLISIGLIKQLSIYPPGSLVRLANQEIAVVVEQNKHDPVAPKVAAIGHSAERLYSQYIIRQSITPSYKIIDAYQPETPVEIDMNRLWHGDTKLSFNAQLKGQ